MRILLPALLCLIGCAGVDERDSSAVAVNRQPVLTFLDAGARVKGSGLFAHLGAVIASCPLGGYVAGAPGDDAVWLSPLRIRLEPARISLLELDPFPVVCLGGTDLKVLVGGPLDAWRLSPDGGSAQALNARVDAFDATPGAWLAVGRAQPGLVSLHSSPAAVLTNASFTSSTVSGRGASVSWGKNGSLLVGNPFAQAAGLFPPDTSVDGGALLISPFNLPNPDPISSSNDFGKVVLVGDVTPDVGEESIVSAPGLGRVYVYSGQVVVLTLEGGLSFGAALALDTRSLDGLHALWVGEPLQNQVHRFVGSDDTVFDAPPEAATASFGAAIAVDARGVVAIGAPRYSEGLELEVGTVFEATLDAGIPFGVAGRCDAGQSCALPGCTTGTCVGAVYCQQTTATSSNCTVGQRCDLAGNVCIEVPDAGRDAGTVDGGRVDAGIVDAGVSDAGVSDAGEPDAGVSDAGSASDAGFSADAGSSVDGGVGDENLVFNTCGCSSGGLPMLLLALLMTRLRRGSSPHPDPLPGREREDKVSA